MPTEELIQENPRNIYSFILNMKLSKISTNELIYLTVKMNFDRFVVCVDLFVHTHDEKLFFVFYLCVEVKLLLES